MTSPSPTDERLAELIVRHGNAINELVAARARIKEMENLLRDVLTDADDIGPDLDRRINAMLANTEGKP